MLSFECIKNEKSVYFLLTSADRHQKQDCETKFGQCVIRLCIDSPK